VKVNIQDLNISFSATSATPTGAPGNAPGEFERGAALDAARGLHLITAFEQEFVRTGGSRIGRTMPTASVPRGVSVDSAEA
jgi:hypothetical protein